MVDSTPEHQITTKLSGYWNSMCLSGWALNHPAVELLNQWATFGCPTHMGQPWIKKEMWAAVAHGPHQSALTPGAIEHFAAEAIEKVKTNQAWIVAWDDIKDNPPPQLQILPKAVIPHKSNAYWSILNLSFRLRLDDGGIWAAVNDTTTTKMLLGFDFGGNAKTMWLEQAEREKLLTMLKGWIWAGKRHLPISLPESGCYHHAIKCCKQDHEWATFTKINQY